MLIKYLKNLFNKTIQPKPTPEKNQIWTFPFDIADKYCTVSNLMIKSDHRSKRSQCNV